MIPRAKEHTIFHLSEALEQLEKTVRELKENSAYSSAEFEHEIAHAYHHLNYAWNSRYLGPKRAWAAQEKDFFHYRQMPKDIDLER